MKIRLWLLCLPVIFYACQKSSSPNSPNGPSGTDTSTLHAKLIGMRSYTNGVLGHRDTFFYDNAGRISKHVQYAYDINPGITYSFTVTLNYHGAKNDPDSYTLSDGWGDVTDTLIYDSQGRLVRDTTIPDLAARACTFNYIGSMINQYSVDNGSSDTLYFTNGNLYLIVQSDLPYDPAGRYTMGWVHDSKMLNPYASVCQTFNLKLLLSKIDGWEIYWNDYMSDKIATAMEFMGMHTIHYTTDASGKVILGTITEGSDTARFEYYYEK